MPGESLNEDARREALARALEDGGDEQRMLLSVYADVLGSPSGQMVLEDIVATFHDRTRELDATVQDAIMEIAHPYRQYYIEGQRSVALTLRAVVEFAVEAQRAELLTEEEGDDA